ncbi:hypothetical protein L584_02445 [Pantoea agglomerans Tx10]|nr:hypothetical protein L584_02445 [Pantoea agglomerans Tx10]KDA95133.1 hypothetical protein T296_07640 [Pantoea agglomerans Eh318]
MSDIYRLLKRFSAVSRRLDQVSFKQKGHQ